MIRYLELARPQNCVMAGLAIAIGGLIGAESTFIDNIQSIAIASIVGCMITAGGNAVNDFYDARIDAINRPDRPIPSGRISPRNALLFSMSLFVIGTALSFFINPICLFIASLSSLVLIYYSYTLKRKILWGNICIGYLVGSTFLFGGAAVGGLMATSVPFLLAMLATVGREIVKDMEDMEGDQKEGIITLPIAIGEKRSAAIASMFLLGTILLSPLPAVLNILGMPYLMVVGFADVCFLAAIVTIKSPSRSSSFLKNGMVVALLAFIIEVAI
ncbi:MAG: geranylgeranylglycerol-phosphate geranylgeranyltransferase [Methanocellales archaeon]|nr:geranylgeranylglycerol-phosphate geranylgeranyltransferase [Methanocellales archaeon]MDD4897882.1 geranylgeranylglycerol-phosphate geranylgeranyltransferase [Methanocellales archaeon]MDD5446448.1 geranylgeranylglycerol-phosphate geranylgeranyltransferase [Methanocellales archaeon]